MYELTTEYHFDSAHFLHGYQGKCENLHGHRWRVVASIGAEKLQESGDERDMVVDFTTFKIAVRELCDVLDHTLIVEEGSLKQSTIDALRDEEFSLTIVPWRTTAENFARYFFQELSGQGFPVTSVSVFETPNNCATYRG